MEVVYSPPAEIPCRRRNSTTAIGAAIPIWAWVGKNAIATVGIAIAITDSVRARRRPTKSPIRPYTIPPSGRTMNPAANAPKAPISDAVGLVDGKELLANHRGEVAIERKVVPLHHVADQAGG